MPVQGHGETAQKGVLSVPVKWPVPWEALQFHGKASASLTNHSTILPLWIQS